MTPTDADKVAAHRWACQNFVTLPLKSMACEAGYLAGVLAERERCAAFVEECGVILNRKSFADSIRRGPQ